MGWHFEPIKTFFFFLRKKTIAADHFSLIFGLIINQQKNSCTKNVHCKQTLKIYITLQRFKIKRGMFSRYLVR